jgi:phage shock protein C
MRSRRNRKIAGVCSGVAEYLALDTNLVRLVWLLCVLLGGTGLLAYIVAWIIMPQEPDYGLVNKVA